MNASFHNCPIATLPFASRTEERELSWLLIVPADTATGRDVAHFTSAILHDGWLPVRAGDTPEVTTWGVRLIRGAVYLRRREGEPFSLGQKSPAWQRTIEEQRALHLVYNPVFRVETVEEAGLAGATVHPLALCARIPLEALVGSAAA